MSPVKKGLSFCLLALALAGCGDGLPFPTGSTETHRGEADAVDPRVSVVQSCENKKGDQNTPITVNATNNCDKSTQVAGGTE